MTPTNPVGNERILPRVEMREYSRVKISDVFGNILNRVPSPPAGEALLFDETGRYLIDETRSFLTAKI